MLIVTVLREDDINDCEPSPESFGPFATEEVRDEWVRAMTPEMPGILFILNKLQPPIHLDIIEGNLAGK